MMIGGTGLAGPGRIGSRAAGASRAVCRGKGTRSVLCEARFGPFRQNRPGPFFVRNGGDHDEASAAVGRTPAVRGGIGRRDGSMAGLCGGGAAARCPVPGPACGWGVRPGHGRGPERGHARGARRALGSDRRGSGPGRGSQRRPAHRRRDLRRPGAKRRDRPSGGRAPGWTRRRAGGRLRLRSPPSPPACSSTPRGRSNRS